ncbi:periplasmic arylsulfatase, sulfate-repressible [Cladochytrium replicatum]|nr:periplasmic arylsulfatase, sulfate-repressible [Cladochytrium replicatum]
MPSSVETTPLLHPEEENNNEKDQRRGRWVNVLLFSLLAVGIYVGAVYVRERVQTKKPVTGKQPNIIFIITDDQDATYDSLKYMPSVQKWLVRGGATYQNHFVTTPVCCPSRTSSMKHFPLAGTQQRSFNVMPPHGGYTKWIKDDLDKDYLPGWLKAAGYSTWFTGKFVVEYSLDNYIRVPRAWDVFDAFVYPWTFRFDIPVFSRNGEWPIIYKGQYQTDVLAQKTLAFVDSAVALKKPFFIYTAPAACHTTVYAGDIKNRPENPIDAVSFEPPIPADRHKHLFSEVELPRPPNFNASREDKPAWLRTLPYLSQQNATYLTWAYRQRLRSLQAVDEFVEDLFTRLQASGELDNTYVFYTADNGYHLGAHALGMGKEFFIEEDIRVPMLARGPGIPAGSVVTEQTLHLDLAATFTALSGAGLPRITDGKVFPIIRDLPGVKADSQLKRPATLVEFWGNGIDEALRRPFLNNTWKAVRTDDAKYVVHCTGERQLYNLPEDPYELNNLLPPGSTLDSIPSRKIVDRLDALLSLLAHCSGETCVDPLASIRHPITRKPLTTLAEALDPSLDPYFNNIAKFGFIGCPEWYDPVNEISAFDTNEEKRNAKAYTEQGGTTVFPGFALDAWSKVELQIVRAEVEALGTPLVKERWMEDVGRFLRDPKLRDAFR